MTLSRTAHISLKAPFGSNGPRVMSATAPAV